MSNSRNFSCSSIKNVIEKLQLFRILKITYCVIQLCPCGRILVTCNFGCEKSISRDSRTRFGHFLTTQTQTRPKLTETADYSE